MGLASFSFLKYLVKTKKNNTPIIKRQYSRQCTVAREIIISKILISFFNLCANPMLLKNLFFCSEKIAVMSSIHCSDRSGSVLPSKAGGCCFRNLSNNGSLFTSPTGGRGVGTYTGCAATFGTWRSA